MEPIYSLTSLQRSPSEVKAAAQDSVVRITEQGAGAYIFCSEKAFERRIQREREDAAFDARMIEAVGRGVADIEACRYVTSVDEAFDRADVMRSKCA